MDNLFRPLVPPKEWHPDFEGLWTERNPWNECVIADWAMGFRIAITSLSKSFRQHSTLRFGSYIFSHA